MRYPAALSYSVHFTRHTAAVRYPAALSIVSVSNRHPAAVRYPAALSIASVSIVIPQECGIQQRCLKRPSLSSSRSSAVSSSPVTASVSNRHTAAVRYPVALSIASVSIVIPQQCCIQQRCLKRPFLSSYRSSAVFRSKALCNTFK